MKRSLSIDQHFVKRKRDDRLISVVLEHPRLIGVGIDEATAIIVNPDSTFDVLGDNGVIVYDATKANSIRTDRNGNLSARNMRMDILSSGDRHSFTDKRVVSPAGR